MNGTSNAVWRKNPVLEWREIDEETVIVAPSNDLQHELNNTASFIWRQVDGRRTTEEIAGLLAGGYEVTPELALADTQTLLQELSEKKLLLPAQRT